MYAYFMNLGSKADKGEYPSDWSGWNPLSVGTVEMALCHGPFPISGDSRLNSGKSGAGTSTT
jgi:hypothetical protein